MNDISQSSFLGPWRMIPLAVRAIVVGFLVNTLGVSAWVVVATRIRAPWSVLAMALLLWAYWKYFSGSWWPQTTAAARREAFRPVRLSAGVWKWSLVAAALFVLLFQAVLVVTFRLMEFPAELFKSEYKALEGAPVWLAWTVIVMAALVAGVCEETGFRGYMQQPLEKRYGPLVAISVVSLVFLSVHLHQAWAGPVLLQIVAVSALLGLLAYASGSLLPGMIAHTCLDIINFAYWWTDVAGRFERRPISETGLDPHAVVWALVLLGSLVLFLRAIRILLRLRNDRSVGRQPSGDSPRT